MCNCGQKSADLSLQNSGSVHRRRSQPSHQNIPEVPFEYIGKTGLTVVGVVTGRTYRFSKPGETVLIDYRDSLTMRSMTMLRRR